MIDLQPSADQDAIVQSVADFLANELPLSRLCTPSGNEPNADANKWPQMGKLGFFSLTLDEGFDSSASALIDEVLIFREMGRFLVSPAALAMVIGARLAAAAGQPELAQAVAQGATQIGFALPSEYGLGKPPWTGDFHIVEGLEAEYLLCWNNSGAGLIARSAVAQAQTVQSIDWTISLQRGQATALRPEFWVDAQTDDIPARAALLTSAMLTGIAEGATQDSVDYVTVRQQFGQPLGAFQSVKHRCADMTTRASAAWCQTLFATLMTEQASPDRAFQQAAAKIAATDAALRNAAADIQNLGGMGFTGEQRPHLFLKRAHLLDRVGGDAIWQSAQLMAMPAR